MTTAATEAVTLQQQLKDYDETMTRVQEMYEEIEQSRMPDYSDVDDVVTTLGRDYLGTFAERTRLSIHPALWNIEALQVGDKQDLELTCTLCDEHLCDIEPSDLFAVLMAMAFDHIKERHLVPEGEETHR
jgi:hypothetical protein